MTVKANVITVQFTDEEARAMANTVNLWLEVLRDDPRLEGFAAGAPLVAAAGKLELAMITEGVQR